MRPGKHLAFRSMKNGLLVEKCRWLCISRYSADPAGCTCDSSRIEKRLGTFSQLLLIWVHRRSSVVSIGFFWDQRWRHFLSPRHADVGHVAPLACAPLLTNPESFRIGVNLLRRVSDGNSGAFCVVRSDNNRR